MNEYLIVAKAKLLSRRLCTLPDPPSPVTYMLWHKSFFSQREDMDPLKFDDEQFKLGKCNASNFREYGMCNSSSLPKSIARE